MVTPIQPSRAQVALTLFALGSHAMWFFGNLYEELIFVPNGLVASPARFQAFNEFFALAKPYVFYVPFTQLGAIATLVAWWLGRRSAAARPIRNAAISSWIGVLLTVWVVLTINMRLWLGDVSAMPADVVHALTVRWGVLNLVRLAAVGVATVALLRAYGRSARAAEAT